VPATQPYIGGPVLVGNYGGSTTGSNGPTKSAAGPRQKVLLQLLLFAVVVTWGT
jgi:hypothetical protein